MKKKFTKFYRVWHWLLAFSVIGLLITVALRKTFLSWRTNSEIIQTQLANNGIEVSHEIAKATAKAIRSGMWEWHYILSVFLIIAIVLRLYMIFTKMTELPIITLIKAKKEDKLKHAIHILLCFSIMLMAISGGVLYFYEELGFTKTSISWLKDTHENMMFGVLALVVLHIVGVIRHEITTKESIVSKMIHGDKD